MPLVSCPDCGHQVADIAPLCPRCGRPNPGRPDAVSGSMMPPPTQTVPNYLAQSILATLCCCLIPGIVAIVYAAQVNSKLAGGDYAGAVASSRNARTWCWVAFGLGAVIYLLYGGAVLIGAMGEVANPAGMPR